LKDGTVDQGEANLLKNGVKLVKTLQSIKSEDKKKEEKDARAGRRNTVHNLARAQTRKRTAPADLDAQFRERLFSLTPDQFNAGAATTGAGLTRRSTIKTFREHFYLLAAGIHYRVFLATTEYREANSQPSSVLALCRKMATSIGSLKLGTDWRLKSSYTQEIASSLA
jgi:hypothetical protein